jgi:hypothetical protein
MKKKLRGKEFYICDVCGEITLDYFIISTFWKPDEYSHFHIRCLEELTGKDVYVPDLTIHEQNFEFLKKYSIWNPECEYRKNGRCWIDRKRCSGYCRYKTESKHRIEGVLALQEIRRRNETA